MKAKYFVITDEDSMSECLAVRDTLKEAEQFVRDEAECDDNVNGWVIAKLISVAKAHTEVTFTEYQ